MTTIDRPLSGKRILLIEDEFLVAADMAREFESGGAEIAGPVPTAEEAMVVLDQPGSIDAAVVDINLRGTVSFRVAERLIARGVPFVFATGYECAMIPRQFDKIPRFEKPIAFGVLARALIEAW